ncbi:hypothetical protein SDC9_189601 [bioreactor metagenome]|uniref:HTH crp-type domain-containing protein n=1 Tax=bioreactor metagenome TaxID=1076179 RepID=A0A645HSM0_9ZZZZ
MVTLPMSKTELAHRLGYARTSLSRELALLRNEELLSFNGRQVHLHISSKSSRVGEDMLAGVAFLPLCCYRNW